MTSPCGNCTCWMQWGADGGRPQHHDRHRRRPSIQVSSLTVAVNTLVRKGYLVRERENRDRRVIRVLLTEKGAEASRVHTQFYGRVVHRVCSRLNEEESQVLVQCLRQLDELFDSLKRPGKTGVSEKKGGS